MRKRPHLAYEFGLYRLDTSQYWFLKGGKEVHLRRKLFDLLVVLVEHAGQTLTKDQLIDKGWRGEVVGDNNLAVSIAELRRVLGNGYIETVSGRGYRFVAEVRVVWNAPESGFKLPPPYPEGLDPPGGALPLNSNLYVVRPADEEFYDAVGRRDSIVLIKGARQVGKTSLLARGLQKARESGAAVVLTDFQHLASSAFETPEKFLRALAELVADQLDLPTLPHENWNSFLSPSINFERYLRLEALAKVTTSLVWGLDEADRLFGLAFASDVFGLFRSWHNLRALDPGGPWQRLTLILTYATEAFLFITDLNQSPFNVGTSLFLEDFTLQQVAELNERYEAPLDGEGEVCRFHALVGGHPYLTQQGLYAMVKYKLKLSEVEAKADDDEGLFGNHLRRMLVSLEREKALREALYRLLHDQPGLTDLQFYRLRSAGVLVGDSPAAAKPRCEIYGRYLRRRLL